MPRNRPTVASYGNRPAWADGLQKPDLGGMWVRTLVVVKDDHNNDVPAGIRMLIMCAGSWRNIYLRTPSCECCDQYRSITADAFKIEPTGESKVIDPFGRNWK